MPITKVLNPDFEKIIADRDMSQPVASDWIDLLYFNSAFVLAVWQGVTGVLNGVLHIEVSNNQSPIDPPKFNESIRVIDTVQGEQGYNIWQLGARWYRLVYTPNGTTGGTLNATITAKDA